LKLVNSEAIDCGKGDLPAGDPPQGALGLSFDEVYRDQFAFVWRSARRLGVREGALDDVVQEIFVIVHRKLPGFEGRSSVRTWLFGIALRFVRDHRRKVMRDRTDDAVDVDGLRASSDGPRESAEKTQAIRLLHVILDEMGDERREVFVMAELEQMPMPDIATTLGINVNTAYARLRAARASFEAALARHRARDEWRLG
jgi:RNA polymerase sigma-70 factor, ECF subfamily